MSSFEDSAYKHLYAHLYIDINHEPSFLLNNHPVVGQVGKRANTWLLCKKLPGCFPQ